MAAGYLTRFPLAVPSQLEETGDPDLHLSDVDSRSPPVGALESPPSNVDVADDEDLMEEVSLGRTESINGDGLTVNVNF